MTISPELLSAFRWHRQQRTGSFIAALRKPVPAASALELARADVAAGKKRYPAERIYAPATRQESGLTFVEVNRAGFRLVGNVEPEKAQFHNSRTGELGWFTDPFGMSARDGTGLCWGVVYQLPGRDGKPRFVAGYVMGGMDDENPTLDLRDVRAGDYGDNWGRDPRDFDAARDMARIADSMAQRAAEEEREYQSAWQAGSLYSSLGEEVAAERADVLKLLQERKAAKGAADPSAYPTICATIRGHVASALKAIEVARAKRAALEAGQYDAKGEMPLYWDTRDPRLVASFREGAGLPASA